MLGGVADRLPQPASHREQRELADQVALAGGGGGRRGRREVTDRYPAQEQRAGGVALIDEVDEGVVDVGRQQPARVTGGSAELGSIEGTAGGKQRQVPVLRADLGNLRVHRTGSGGDAAGGGGQLFGRADDPGDGPDDGDLVVGAVQSLGPPSAEHHEGSVTHPELRRQAPPVGVGEDGVSGRVTSQAGRVRRADREAGQQTLAGTRHVLGPDQRIVACDGLVAGNGHT